MQIFQTTRIDFVRLRHIALVISAAAILASITLLSLGRLKMGVDFTGGHLVQVRFEGGTVAIGRLRQILFDGGISNAEVQSFTEGLEYVVRAPLAEEAEGGSGTKLERVLAAGFPEGFEIVRTEDVGPKIGAELSRNALRAILWALGLILVYISWRFELRFAVGAVIALAHDVLITAGVLAFTGREVSLSVVAALLTIVGYSLNDTIVIFDRIREELRLQRREPLPAVINAGINKSLSRTVITSVTTLVVLLMLYVFGGKVINDFAFTLLFGVLVGTYSSIFVASPVVLEWERIKPRSRRTKRTES